jgi:hypothetical protein
MVHPLQIEGVQTGHSVVAHVARVPPHLLVAAGAEGVGPLAGEEHHADLLVLSRPGEGIDQLEDRGGSKRVAHLRPVDGDLRDSLRLLEADVPVVSNTLPVDCSHRPSCGALDVAQECTGDAVEGLWVFEVGGMPGLGNDLQARPRKASLEIASDREEVRILRADHQEHRRGDPIQVLEER